MDNMIWFLLIPINLVVLNIWIWLFKNIFDIQRHKAVGLTVFVGVFSGLAIFFYDYILEFLSISNISFSDQANLQNPQSILYFRGYLSVITILIKLAVSKFKISKFFIFSYTIFSILLVGSWFLTQQLPNIKTFLVYYIFVAFGEEFIKYMLALNIFDKNKITDNDLILFCILSAIGFAFIENIIYLYNGIQGNQNSLSMLVGGTGILISRGVIGFLVHIIFTGNIGLLAKPTYKTKNTKLIYGLFIGILLGTGLHYGYNVGLHNEYQIIILIAILTGYGWISYLFYQSDRLYIKDGLKI